MKTTFVRQFLLTAVLILFSIVVVGAAFHSLLFNHLTAEEEDSLQTNANAVADLAAAYDTSGELEENWNFRMSQRLSHRHCGLRRHRHHHCLLLRGLWL